MTSLFILAFDHRANFAKHLLGYAYPRLTSSQRKKVTELKEIVFDGFLKTWRLRGRSKKLAILIDEEFGKTVIQKAKRLGIKFAVPVEKSGKEIFDFAYGARFEAHLKNIKPTFAKALVRYDTARKAENKLQRKRLVRLAAFCKKNKLELIIELLLVGSGSRAAQLRLTLKEMAEAGIEPSIFKLEGLNKDSDWRNLRGYTKAFFIVLGRGEARAAVERWLKIAKQSGEVRGFAIGRTIFFKPLQLYIAQKIDRAAAVAQIAKNYAHFIKVWEK